MTETVRRTLRGDLVRLGKAISRIGLNDEVRRRLARVADRAHEEGQEQIAFVLNDLSVNARTGSEARRTVGAIVKSLPEDPQ